MRKPSIFLVSLLFASALLPSCNKQGAEPSEVGVEEIVITSPKNGKLELTQGETAKIKYTVLPESAAASAVIEWTSSNPEVATVKNGKVSSWSEGKTTVTATCGKASAEVEVTVDPVPVVSFSVPASMELFTELPYEVEVSVELDPDADVEDLEASAAALNWEVSDEDVLKVEFDEGKAVFTGLKTGKCTVTVSAKSPKEGSEAEKSQTISVTVSELTSRISFLRMAKGGALKPIEEGEKISRDDIYLNMDGKKVLIVSCSIPDFKKEDLSITSSDESIFTLSLAKITEPSEGTFTIFLTLDFNGTFGSTDICITVQDREYNLEHKCNFTLKVDPKGIEGEMVVTAPDGTEIKNGGSFRLDQGSSGDFSINSGYEAKWEVTDGSDIISLAHSGGSEYWAPKAEITATSNIGTATVKVTDQSDKSMSFTLKVTKPTFPKGIYIVDNSTGQKASDLAYVPAGEEFSFHLSDSASKGIWKITENTDYFTTSTTQISNSITIKATRDAYLLQSSTKITVTDESGENVLSLSIAALPRFSSDNIKPYYVFLNASTNLVEKDFTWKGSKTNYSVKYIIKCSPDGYSKEDNEFILESLPKMTFELIKSQDYADAKFGTTEDIMRRDGEIQINWASRYCEYITLKVTDYWGNSLEQRITPTFDFSDTNWKFYQYYKDPNTSTTKKSLLTENLIYPSDPEDWSKILVNKENLTLYELVNNYINTGAYGFYFTYGNEAYEYNKGITNRIRCFLCYDENIKDAYTLWDKRSSFDFKSDPLTFQSYPNIINDMKKYPPYILIMIAKSSVREDTSGDCLDYYLHLSD